MGRGTNWGDVYIKTTSLKIGFVIIKRLGLKCKPIFLKPKHFRVEWMVLQTTDFIEEKG